MSTPSPAAADRPEESPGAATSRAGGSPAAGTVATRSRAEGDVVGSPETAGPTAARRGRELVARWTGRVLVIAALWSAIAAPFRHVHWMRAVTDAFEGLAMPVGPSLFSAVLLLALAGPIRRRFRAAHGLLVVVMVLEVVAGAADLWFRFSDELYEPELSGHPALVGISVATGAVVTALVIWSRPVYTTHIAGRSRRAAVVVLLGGIAASYLLCLGLTMLVPGTLTGLGEASAWAVRGALGDLVEVGGALEPGHHGEHWVVVVSGLVSTVALLAALAVLWRAERQSAMQSADDELAVRALLLEYGEDDSLGYFATRRDKAVVFSPDRRAAIAFRAEGSVSVASGDPVGDPASWDAAIGAWLADTREHGRYAAVLSASETASAAYVRHGLRALALGDEAVIDTGTFTLSGRAMKSVRHAVARVERSGYTARVRRHRDLDPAELAEVARLADAWRGEDTERGFSMALGRMADPADGRCLLVTAHDADGTVQGLLSFVPWGRRGVSLDLMRRSPAATSGVTEFMVAALMDAAEGQGIRRVSLNFAVFRRVFSDADRVGAGPVTRLSDAVLTFVSRFYQLDSLYRSNEKYGPDWVPRMLCYDPTLTVARAGLTMGVAEGFLPSMTPRVIAGSRPSAIQPPRSAPGFAERVAAQERELALPAAPEYRLNEQQRVRHAKLDALAAAGREAYPAAVPRTASVAEVLGSLGAGSTAATPESGAPGDTGEIVSVVGRVRALRDFGGVSFAVLEEGGDRIQAMVTRADTPGGQRDDWRRLIDLGDRVSVTGTPTRSRTGEPSVLVRSWDMAAKCLNPVPDLHARLADDVRTRHRTLDLLAHRESLDLLRRRALGVRALREAFVDDGYLEVETPMLQAVHGGASARPFTTHINAYDMTLYLRIAPELYLKRLMVAGMDRIFEVGRNFRNEGADATHNPEFTACEAYAAYADYDEMRRLTRRVILAVARAINGAEVALRPDGEGGYTEFDLSGEWPVVTIHDAVTRALRELAASATAVRGALEAAGGTLTAETPAAEVAAVCEAAGVPVGRDDPAGIMVMELYDAFVEKQTTMPTFYCDFPVEVSPLARPHRTTPGLTEQWDLVGFGAELGCAYSELIDPVEQRRRLTEQSLAAAAGDAEAMQLDEDFLDSLAYGMPPTGGLGIGVDRVVMLLRGQSIRATLAFPFVRPR